MEGNGAKRLGTTWRHRLARGRSAPLAAAVAAIDPFARDHHAHGRRCRWCGGSGATEVSVEQQDRDRGQDGRRREVGAGRSGAAFPHASSRGEIAFSGEAFRAEPREGAGAEADPRLPLSAIHAYEKGHSPAGKFAKFVPADHERGSEERGGPLKPPDGRWPGPWRRGNPASPAVRG